MAGLKEFIARIESNAELGGVAGGISWKWLETDLTMPLPELF